MDKKIYLTKKGLEELKKEHDELIKTKRPQTVGRLATARDMGDLAENAEYTAARDELGFIDGRIDELEDLVKNATIIAEKAHGKKSKIVNLGSKVIIKTKGRKEIFTIVGEWESNPEEKKISNESPLGKALIGKMINDKIEINAPAGKIGYKIIAIE
ncbi:transcription elongation factor GreA [Patescibacteria group bacterium]|nr:transcription elongation factor GreA [Patescibacteria group bacterium]